MLLGRPHDRADHGVEADVRRILQRDEIVIPRAGGAPLCRCPLGIEIALQREPLHLIPCLLEIAFDIGPPLSRLEVPFEFAGPILDRLQVPFEFPPGLPPSWQLP